MNRLAEEVEQALEDRAVLGAPAATTATTLGEGHGWRVDDILCTRGPGDRPFEERHALVSVSVVLSGTFQVRSDLGTEMMSPGSIMLGSVGQCFECGHEHAAGDRCVAFRFTEEYFEGIAAAVGVKAGSLPFRRGRLPPLRELSPLSARVVAGALRAQETSWEELAVEVAARALRMSNDLPGGAACLPRGAEARVTEIVRAIERDPAAPLNLDGLAAAAGLSRYHFLRSFRQVTGVTPHQFILRTRLRNAAARLATGTEKVIGVAFGSGFGDLSNFNQAFRREFGTNPRRFRALLRSS